MARSSDSTKATWSASSGLGIPVGGIMPARSLRIIFSASSALRFGMLGVERLETHPSESGLVVVTGDAVLLDDLARCAHGRFPGLRARSDKESGQDRWNEFTHERCSRLLQYIKDRGGSQARSAAFKARPCNDLTLAPRDPRTYYRSDDRTGARRQWRCFLLESRPWERRTRSEFREDVARAQARGVQVIRFTIGEPDFDSAPHINQAGIDGILKGNTHYTDPAGVRALREATAAHVKKTRGIDVDPDEVIILPGAKPAIGYSLMSYVDPGDEVIYPSPGFPIYESWVTYLGGAPVPLVLREENGFAFTPDELEKLVTPKTKVLMLCSPSNPTGGVLSQELLEGVAEIVRRKAHPDCRVYSDEIYEHITFDGFRHFSIASVPGMRERTIIASGHSKGFAMTGWRLGWCGSPQQAGSGDVQAAQHQFRELRSSLHSRGRRGKLSRAPRPPRSSPTWSRSSREGGTISFPR